MDTKKDYRTILTEKLIEQLEAGTAPWQKPWDAAAGISRLPYNPATGKEYRGANSLYLSMHGHNDPRWATYKQAAAEGWQVRKGEKGALIEYWKMSEERPLLDEKTGKPVLDDQGKPKTIHVTLERPQVFRAVVFNASQMDGVPELSKEPRQYEWNPVQRAEQILEASGAKIYHDQNDRAFYRPSTDQIHLPGREQFQSESAYYSTALHELGHWTGHETRLDRDLTGGFGSPDYAKEELRAELSSYFMADKLGIQHDPGQHAAYVGSWIKVLKEDKNEIFRAAKAAEEITEYVLHLDRDRSQEIGLEIGGKAHALQAENSEIASSIRDFKAIHQKDMTPAGYAAEVGARERMDDVMRKYLGVTASVEWSGDVKVVGLVDVEHEGKTMPIPAINIPEQPKYYGVYTVDKDGMDEWAADLPSLSAAKQLADRLTTVYQVAMPGQNRQPEVSYIVPPAPEKEPAKERVDLDVPFKDKEAVKALGAKWDTKGKTWYVPPGTDLKPLGNWMPKAVEKAQSSEVAFDTLAVEGARQLVASAGIALGAMYSEEPETRNAELAQARRMESEAYAKLASVDVEQAQALVAVEQGKVVNDQQLKGAIRFDPAKYHDALAQAPVVSVEQKQAPELASNVSTSKTNGVSAERERPAEERAYLAVPFKEKDQARAAGAKWDIKGKAWYAPAGADMSKLQQWAPKAEVAQAVTHAPLVDPAVEFAKAIRAAGLEIVDKQGNPLMVPEMDGKLHRVPLVDGKHGNRDGAYVGYLDGRPAGSIQNWKTGEKTNWKHEGPELSAEQRAELAAAAAIKKQMRAAELSTQHNEAADKAGKRWERAADMPQDGTTPYLERKQVQAFGVKRDGDNLLIPARDIDGKLWSIQTVFPEKKELAPGTDPLDKVFTKDARKEGNFHLIGEIKPGQPVITMEGYATGASVHQATGYAVAVAFDSGNLDAVVGALKERYPTNPHFIGADDDRFPKPGQPEKNAGLTKANEAAQKHEVGVIVPVFSTAGRLTDFNDLHVSEGLAVVKQQIDHGVSLSMEQSRQTAEQLAKARLGSNAEVKVPGDNTRHTGTVLGVSGYHAAQATSTAVATIHQVKDLETVPAADEVATIQYKDGRGKVTAKSPEKKKELQR